MEHVDIGQIESGVLLEDDQLCTPAFLNHLILSPQKLFDFPNCNQT